MSTVSALLAVVVIRVAAAGFLVDVAAVLAADAESPCAGCGFFAARDDAECPVDFGDPPAVELLDADGPVDPVAPPSSADATGIDAIAAPTPSAMADAPIQVAACE
ncbi:hypothetical protein [Mycobacterium sp. DL592]|uniref:hypothetical protein n=1 Tax=Mycobacterium sp. DL592 TaxID=2675524 RepID=UPI00142459EF|nr:hypothetical protein [Mycobacterium sp. DL592]